MHCYAYTQLWGHAWGRRFECRQHDYQPFRLRPERRIYFVMFHIQMETVYFANKATHVDRDLTMS